jgi:apolipoprotein N-acyltransferase
LYPLLFPWYFAASVHQVPLLSQLGEAGGPYIVGLVLATPSLGLAELVLARRQNRPIDRRLVVAGLLTPVVAALIGWVRIAQVEARMLTSEKVHVGIVQGDMPLLQKRDDHAESLRRHLRMTEELRSKGAEFAVWSESSVMWSIPEDDYDNYLQHLFTRRLRIPVLFGALLIGRDTDGRRAYNVALASDAQGRVVGRYDKHYLLAFGEYIPFGETFPILYQWSPNSSHLTPGTSSEPVMLGGHPVTPLVCYEDILPDFVNRAVNHGHSEMIVNVTNDAWFGDTTEPWIHLALAKMRAIEHRRYLLRSTNSGVSAVIDPVGRVVAHSSTYRQETVDVVARWMKGSKTIYEIVGDAPWWGGGGVMVARCARHRNDGLLPAAVERGRVNLRTLAARLVEGNRGGHAGVERVDGAPHGEASDARASAAHRLHQSFALRSDDDDHRAGEVDLRELDVAVCFEADAGDAPCGELPKGVR